MEDFQLNSLTKHKLSIKFTLKEGLMISLHGGAWRKDTKTLTNMCNPLSYTLPHYMLENLCELTLIINLQQVVTKGYPNGMIYCQ